MINRPRLPINPPQKKQDTKPQFSVTPKSRNRTVSVITSDIKKLAETIHSPALPRNGFKNTPSISKPNSEASPKVPFKIEGSAKDELFHQRFESYKASLPDAITGTLSKRGASVRATTSPRPNMTSTLIPKEYTKVADIVASLPDDFNLSGWDDRSARQQQHALKNSGLSKEDQMSLLNAAMSLETISVIQKIQKNRLEYGLSAKEMNNLSKQLLEISNARIGAKNHSMPFSENARSNNTFLQLLDEKENKLLASFGYGMKQNDSGKGTTEIFQSRMNELLSGDASISDALRSSGDILSVSDSFFTGMEDLGALIGEVNSDTIPFQNTAEKKHYLDYLTTEYERNDLQYRRRLAGIVDEAKLLDYPDSQFKQIINELSLPQLCILADQINEKGARKLSKAGNFEKLMRALLSDQESALSIKADDTISPIRPHVWNGMDIVNDESVEISGYYYRNGKYFSEITCPGEESYVIDLGTKLPKEVAIEVTRATDWDIQSQKLALLITKLENLVDLGYNIGLGFGMPALLPLNLSPSDIPAISEFLNNVDPQNNIGHMTKETIVMKFVTHLQNTSNTTMQRIQFFKYKG